MDKLTKTDATSPDLVAANIERMRSLFPEIFVDGHIDFDTLKEALGEYVDDRDERYSFTWHGKSRARQIAQMPSAGTLRPCPEDSVDWDTTKNIFIEGDNLEVLKLLQKSYHRKVKMIYIDPPYNTGKEFIYPDKWQDNLHTYLRYTGQVSDEGFTLSANTETSGRYHTNWLNMMYPRLKLSRNLLTDDGIIFVSIDDHEVHNLRHILDELFGPENFITQIVWQKKYTRANDARFVSDNHDHILAYARSIDDAAFNLLPRTEAQTGAYKNPDNHPKGPWKSTPLHAKSGSNTSAYTFTNGLTWAPPPGTYRRFSDERMAALEKGNEIWFGAGGTATPSRKSFLSETKDGLTPVTIWPHDEVGHTHEANDELKARLGAGNFPNPKPTRLMRRMLQLATNPASSDLILDFFAGSGTLGDAILQQNAADGGNRRFLLVQLPEPIENDHFSSIAEVCRARLTNATAESSPASDRSNTSHTSGFRLFTLSDSNIKPWDADFDSMEDDLVEAIDNIKDDRSEDDVLYELLLKYGLDLAIPSETRDLLGCKLTVIGAGALVVCLADDITLEVVSGIATLKDELQPEVMRVVFKDSGFADDVIKTNADQILRQAGIDDVKSL